MTNDLTSEVIFFMFLFSQVSVRAVFLTRQEDFSAFEQMQSLLGTGWEIYLQNIFNLFNILY